jgi:hypothetical protein
MDEQKDKKYVTEWSFSFEKLNDQIGEFVKSVGVSAQDSIKQGQFSTPLSGAESARVRLDLSVAETNITALPADSPNLLDADLIYVGEINFVTEGEAERVVHLAQVAGASDWFRSFFGWIGSRRTLKWDVGLTPTIPLDLDIRTGVGESNLELGALNIRSLHVNGGTGEFTVVLPAPAQPYTAVVNSGVGETRFTIPDNATCDLSLRIGTGESTIVFGENVSMNAKITGGIGECTIQLPEGAAARIEAKTGIGAVRVPPRFARLSGDNTEGFNARGIWQTTNYEAAERKITLHYDGGIGELNVR